jgi:hypothetical protein
VRRTHEAVDLWMLRSDVFDALAARGPQARALCDELQRALASVFPEALDATLPATL